jgi:sn-glycerol 3-phosphate transport system permease protein
MLAPRRPHHPYLMVAPTVALLGVFFLLPLGVAAHRSLYSWDLLTPPRWAGMRNYARMLESGELARVLGTTLSYSVVVVAGAMALGLALALAVNRPGRLPAFVRASVFSAYVVSWVSVALLWMWLLDADSGIVGKVLRALGAGHGGLLAHPSTALVALAAVTVWKITGYSMVVFLTGLQDIPKELYDAAALDGAGRLSRFAHVTWPLLRPTTAFVGTTSLIVSFQAFDVVRVMTQGGPAGSTTVFVYAIYEHVFLNLRVGRASAMVVVFFALLLGLTALQLWAWRLGRRGAA